MRDFTSLQPADAVVIVIDRNFSDARREKHIVDRVTKLRDRVRQDAEYAEDEGA